MTALIVALLMTRHQTPVMKSQDILANCLAKYAAASSVTGEFLMTQTSGGKKVSVKTELQIERPSKIYLHQTSDSVSPNEWLVVSDGSNFGYDLPKDQLGARKRLFEPVVSQPNVTGERMALKVHSIYLATKRSLGDVPNPFVEFSTQSAGDNISVKGFLTRLKYSADAKEKAAADGTPVYSISGTIWLGDAIKNSDGSPSLDSLGNPKYESAGRYEMQFSKEFDLLSMKSTETISITDKANNLPTQIIIVTTWTGKISVNQTPVQALFKVR